MDMETDGDDERKKLNQRQKKKEKNVFTYMQSTSRFFK